MVNLVKWPTWSKCQLGQMVMLMFPTRYGATPLHMAAAAGHLSTVKAVLEAGGGDDCQFHDQLIVKAISTVYWIRTFYSCPAVIRSWRGGLHTIMSLFSIYEISLKVLDSNKQWHAVARSGRGGHQLKTEQLSVSNHDWCSAWERCSPQVRSFIFVLIWSSHMTKFDHNANQLDPHRTS